MSLEVILNSITRAILIIAVILWTIFGWHNWYQGLKLKILADYELEKLKGRKVKLVKLENYAHIVGTITNITLTLALWLQIFGIDFIKVILPLLIFSSLCFLLHIYTNNKVSKELRMIISEIKEELERREITNEKEKSKNKKR